MNYYLGLDIGIGSIGWAIMNLDKLRLEDFGVRLFDTGEDQRKNERYSQQRRRYRGIRRLYRRSHRKQRLKNYLGLIGFITENELNTYYDNNENNVIKLRYIGLSEKLSPAELAACLIHICNNRGYKDFYEINIDEIDDPKERKEYEEEHKALNHINQLMKDGGYRTPAEMIYKNAEFDSLNSIYRDYHNSAFSEQHNLIARNMLEKEVELILEQQSNFYKCIDKSAISNIKSIIFSQRDFETGPGNENDKYRKFIGYLDTLGKCRFYKNKDRGCRFTVIADAEEFPNIMFNDPTLIEHSDKIIESFVKVMQDKGSNKIEITNGDEEPFENKMQSYVNEGEFATMYRKLLTILQKKSVYRYKLDTDEFISATASEIERQLAKKNDFIQFKITKADADFSESRKMQMGNTQSQVEDSTNHTITYEERPLFELVNMIMMHTMLPRLAIIRIIKKLSDKARNKINNQDYLEEAISIINQQLVSYKSKQFLDAELVASVGSAEKDIFEVDKIANEEEIRYLFTPNPARRRAMNLKYKFDSEGEYIFAKALDEDPNVLLYTKLKKGGFVIETPVGNYSPDWAIVYQKDNEQLAMYFIAETKWDKEAGDLSDDEKIKIRCATKHFEAVDGSMKDKVKYAWVNAYKDTTQDHSFPQIFIDENYFDTLTL